MALESQICKWQREIRESKGDDEDDEWFCHGLKPEELANQCCCSKDENYCKALTGVCVGDGSYFNYQLSHTIFTHFEVKIGSK